ncbi:MAG: hypothetical protein HPY45_06130 [Anaerolineae bacterium]|nr:hypothetical protein [Anaerolineae bacterium]
MELQEIMKRLEWLDEERRKDKSTISLLENRLVTLEGNIASLVQQISDGTDRLAQVEVILARLDNIDLTISQARVEASRSLENLEKQRIEREREMEKSRRSDLEGVNKAIGELRKGFEAINEIRKSLQLRVDEENRLGRLLEELKNNFEESQRAEEERQRSQRITEEGRRQDAKRLMDLQGEVIALRKRGDEQRGKLDVMADSVRKVELRMSEFQAAENERRQMINSFVEKLNLQELDRERVWKEWQGRFEEIIQRAVALDTEMQALEATNRALKRSQQEFEEITQRFDRRVNEITEMQRLTEERFRQEWTVFKADDQKRWMNYMLAQEEQQREMNRLYEKVNERLALLEDITQEIRDFDHQVSEHLERQMQDLLNMTHQWADNFEKITGKPK